MGGSRATTVSKSDSAGLKQLCLISRSFSSLDNRLSSFIWRAFIKSNFVISSVPGISARRAPKEIKERIPGWVDSSGRSGAAIRRYETADNMAWLRAGEVGRQPLQARGRAWVGHQKGTKDEGAGLGFEESLDTIGGPSL